MTRFRALVGRYAGRFAVAGLLFALGVGVGAIAFALQPPVSGDVGPGSVEIDPSLRPGDTVVDLPPLGQVRADSHRGPLGFDARVDRIDLDRAGDVAMDADPANALRDQVESDLRPLIAALARQSFVVALIAGAGLALVLPRRRWRYALATVAGSVGFVAVAGGVAAVTFEPSAFDHPEFEGALAAAPDILSTVQRHIDDVSVVEGRLAALSDRVVGLYRSVDGSAGPTTADTVILHVSDIHSNPVGIELVEETARRFDVDAIIDTGDLTSFGAPIEKVVVDRISTIATPYYVVPGNHDADSIREALVAAGVEVLDPGVADVEGIKILGMGDPTFTADNKVSDDVFEDNLLEAGDELRRLVRRERPDVVAVHNVKQMEASFGSVAVGLAGHLHKPGLSLRRRQRRARGGQRGSDRRRGASSPTRTCRTRCSSCSSRTTGSWRWTGSRSRGPMAPSASSGSSSTRIASRAIPTRPSRRACSTDWDGVRRLGDRRSGGGGDDAVDQPGRRGRGDLAVLDDLAQRRNRIVVVEPLGVVVVDVSRRLVDRQRPVARLEGDARRVVEVDRADEAVVDHVGDLAVVFLESPLQVFEGGFVGEVEREVVELAGLRIRDAGGLREGVEILARVLEERHRLTGPDAEEVVLEVGVADRGDDLGPQHAVPEAGRRVHVVGDQGEVVDPSPRGIRRRSHEVIVRRISKDCTCK